jgi:hypothetical protein
MSFIAEFEYKRHTLFTYTKLCQKKTMQSINKKFIDTM